MLAKLLRSTRSMEESGDSPSCFFTPIARINHGPTLWIAGNDNKRMVNANDGGANVSVNGGQTWTDQDYPTAQLYHITATNHQPYWVCGAQQDNSTACVRSRGWRGLEPVAKKPLAAE